MHEINSDISKDVCSVFLVPYDFSISAKPLALFTATLPIELRSISTSFIENLLGVIRTLSIPFNYTRHQVHALHWQSFQLAARIRTRGIENEAQRKQAALESAKENFGNHLSGDGFEKVVSDIFDRLLWLKNDTESLAAARELTRQGLVLTWSAIEVLVRDAFVYLLNQRPDYADRLLIDPANRKRFNADRIEWQALANYGYDLSSSLGSYLISKADLKNVSAIRGVYGALFPEAVELQKLLGESRLWNLCQKRNLIVHKRGVVDQQYVTLTSDNLAIGEHLLVTPSEVESSIEFALEIGKEIVSRVADAI